MTMSKKSKKTNSLIANLPQTVLGISIALIGFIGLQMVNNLEVVTEKVTTIESNQNVQSSDFNFYKEEIKSIKDVLKAPKFTKEDFDIAINPVIKQLNNNTEELNVRSDLMEIQNNKILRLEYRIENLEK